MLVLGRKESQRVIIDGKIVVTIVRVAGGNVRLGIEAPAHISVQREEIAKRKHGAPSGALVTSDES